MKKRRFVVSFIFMLASIFALYSGASADSRMSWNVTWDGQEPYVHYCYTFYYGMHDPSHFIFEVSSDFSSSDMTNVTVDGVATTPSSPGWFIPDRANNGGHYQTMPEKIYGVKIDNAYACPDGVEECAGMVEVCFDSTRQPVWGDFYARCGVRAQHVGGIKIWNSAWNAGFTNPDNDLNTADDLDPTAGPSSGSVDDHLLVPDTVPVSGQSFSYSGDLSMGGLYDGYLNGTGDWAAGPTVITLASFTATRSKGNVLVQWETATEIDCAGFNVWRSETENGGYTQLNSSLISCTGDGSQYKFVDRTAKGKKSFYYQLEDIDLNGISIFNGPVSVTGK